jgi:hypothetical protein
LKAAVPTSDRQVPGRDGICGGRTSLLRAPVHRGLVDVLDDRGSAVVVLEHRPGGHRQGAPGAEGRCEARVRRHPGEVREGVIGDEGALCFELVGSTGVVEARGPEHDGRTSGIVIRHFGAAVRQATRRGVRAADHVDGLHEVLLVLYHHRDLHVDVEEGVRWAGAPGGLADGGRFLLPGGREGPRPQDAGAGVPSAVTRGMRGVEGDSEEGVEGVGAVGRRGSGT